MKRAKTRIASYHVPKLATGGSTMYSTTAGFYDEKADKNAQMKSENDQIAKVATDTAASYGGIWGALAQMGTSISTQTRGDESSSKKNIVAQFQDPWNQFKNNESTKDWGMSFLNPVMSAHVKGRRQEEEFERKQMFKNQASINANNEQNIKLSNSLPTYKAPAYGAKGMKFKTKFSKK